MYGIHFQQGPCVSRVLKCSEVLFGEQYQVDKVLELGTHGSTLVELSLRQTTLPLCRVSRTLFCNLCHLNKPIKIIQRSPEVQESEELQWPALIEDDN